MIVRNVSVVITSFNHGHFLPDAIHSALSQSLPPAEILVVDDGSTDHTAEVVKGFPAVRYFYQENAGLSAARNAGLRASSGKFVMFLDADDVLEPRALAIGSAYLSAHPEWAFVSGGHRRVDRELKQIGEERCWPVHSEHYKALLHGNYIGMHATVLYRRSALEAIGGFDETLTACEDYDVYLRAARQYPIGSHSEVVASYRQHGSNMSARLDNMLTMAMRVHHAQREFAMSDATLRRAWRLGERNWWVYFGDQVFREVREPKLLLRVLMHYPFVWKALRNAPLRPRNLARLVRERLRGLRKPAAPEPFEPGSFRQAVPLGNEPESVVSRYINRFLDAHLDDLRDVLEIGAEKFPIARLAEVPDGSQSCVLCVLQLRAFEPGPIVAQLRRVLKPAGVLLAVLPGVVLRSHAESQDDYWRYTEMSARRLFAAYFPDDLDVTCCGNSVTALAALHQLPAESLDDAEFAPADFQQQLLVTIRARRT